MLMGVQPSRATNSPGPAGTSFCSSSRPHRASEKNRRWRQAKRSLCPAGSCKAATPASTGGVQQYEVLLQIQAGQQQKALQEPLHGKANGHGDLAHLHPPKACHACQLTSQFGAGIRDVCRSVPKAASRSSPNHPPTPPRTCLRKHDALRAQQADGAEGAHKVKVVHMGRDAVALRGGGGGGGAGASQLVTWMGTGSKRCSRERSSRAEPKGAPELPAAVRRVRSMPPVHVYVPPLLLKACCLINTEELTAS